MMLTEKVRKDIQDILCLSSADDIEGRLQQLRSANLSEYEKQFTWVLKELSSPLYCLGVDEIPYHYLEQSFRDDELSDELQAVIANTKCAGVAARLNDCLWIHKSLYPSAKLAISIYAEEIKKENNFDSSQACLYRIISIYLSLKDEFLRQAVVDVVRLVLKQGEDANDFSPYHILSCCFENQILPNDEIISRCDACITDKQTYPLTDAYLELTEKAMAKKLKINLNAKYIYNAEIEKVRRKRVALYEFNAKAESQNFRKIDLYKKAILLLKKIDNAEKERAALRDELSAVQKTLIAEMPSFSHEFDISKQVEHIRASVNAISPAEYLYFFISYLPVIQREDLRNETIESNKRFLSKRFFPPTKIDKKGKIKAVVPTLDIQDGKSVIANMEHDLNQKYLLYVDVYIKHIFYELKRKDYSFDDEVSHIIEKSYFVPESRKRAFVAGISTGFDGDFLVALSILCPQIENAVRCLAEECGDVVYSIDNQGKESVRTFDDVLTLPNLNKCIDENILFNIKAIFTSEYCLNMRNEVAHGLLDDNEFNSLQAIYTWWFILKLCFIFHPVDRAKLDAMFEKLATINKKYENDKC